MVKHRVGQGCLLHVIIPLHILLFSEHFINYVKKPSHFSMFAAKLMHNKTLTKNKKPADMVEFIKTCDQCPC